MSEPEQAPQWEERRCAWCERPCTEAALVLAAAMRASSGGIVLANTSRLFCSLRCLSLWATDFAEHAPPEGDRTMSTEGNVGYGALPPVRPRCLLEWLNKASRVRHVCRLAQGHEGPHRCGQFAPRERGPDTVCRVSWVVDETGRARSLLRPPWRPLKRRPALAEEGRPEGAGG